MFAETIQALLSHMLSERGLSYNYLALTRRSLEKFSIWMATTSPSVDPNEVKREHLTDYLGREHARGMAPASIKTDVAAFKIFFRFLRARGYSKADPAELLRLPKVAQLLPDILSETEVEQLLSVDFGSRNVSRRRDRSLPLRDQAVLELLYASGIRNAELADSRMHHLDLEARTLRVIGKGSKERLVCFGRPAAVALENYLDGERGGRRIYAKSLADREMIFLSWNGRRMTTCRIWQVLQESALLVGLDKPVYPHLLRHSCATHMLRRGCPLHVIQSLLGHESLSTTGVYLHLCVADLKAVHRRCHPRP
jgi:integrase/recombinase XerD